ncbi:glycosyltransferase [Hafnia alvei]|uniref:Glycosyltransferase n=1 Tax=Hafnia alvei TaxID=569 RepID=A0A172X084_HAFAL|nr:glycosyltransferase [Hafnia alvei]ANF30036.1 UDP-gal:alpha-D-glcNac-diphosphoundecaprenol beta-1,3-galactosyltransferase [Hafnia alvei]TBL64671.1 glycosyltransferase [Hafnia alvei]
MTTELAVISSLYYKEEPTHLEQFLQSLASQTYNDFVLYICFDGVLGYELTNVISKYEGRLIIIKNEVNLGLAASLNKLIENVLFDSSIKYVARMDTDDICFPERFERQINFFENNPNIDVVGSWCLEFDESGNQFEKKMPLNDAELKRDIFKRSPFIHPSVMFRRDLFMKGMRYPTHTELSEDLYFWMALASKKYVFANINEPLLYFRVSKDLYDRRRGLKKAWSELKVRVHGMHRLKQFNCRNILFSFFYFILRIMPSKVIKIAYKHLR